MLCRVIEEKGRKLTFVIRLDREKVSSRTVGKTKKSLSHDLLLDRSRLFPQLVRDAIQVALSLAGQSATTIISNDREKKFCL